MTAILSKPCHEITSEDIQALIDSRIQENERIEFKRELSGRHGKPSRWMSGETRLEESAKLGILKEIVALANAYGGALVLGIEEDSTQNPGVASAICPIPNCKELAQRFMQIIDDSVEPRLPKYEVLPVVTVGSDEGVIVFRIPEGSRGAPHGIRTTNMKYLCPIRRWDRCETMSMREIQDMTLKVNLGLQRLLERLKERDSNFKYERSQLNSSNNAYGIRITAAPVADDIRLRKVFGTHAGLVQGLDAPKILITRNQSGQKHPEIFKWGDLHKLGWTGWKPQLRAARRSHVRATSRFDYLEIHCNGLVEYGRWADIHPRRHKSVHSYDPIRELANVMCWADVLRSYADVRQAEYAVEVTIHVEGNTVPFGPGPGRNPDPALGAIGKMPPGVTTLPILRMIEFGEAGQLLTVFEQDLCHAAGIDAIDEWYEVDYRH